MLTQSDRTAMMSFAFLSWGIEHLGLIEGLNLQPHLLNQSVYSELPNVTQALHHYSEAKGKH